MKKIAITSLVLMMALMVMMSVSAYAEDDAENSENAYVVVTEDGAENSENAYVVVTNEDGSDPVYVELTEQNSTQSDSGVELNENQKEEGKTYSETVTTQSSDPTVYQITGEITDVENMENGENYSFITGEDAKNIKVGDVLTQAPEGGATLTYTGDGTDNNSDNSNRSVTGVFQDDKEMVQSYVDVATKAAEYSTAEEYCSAVVTEEINKYWNYYSKYYATKEDAIAENTQDYSEYLTEKYTQYKSDVSAYQEMLANMNEVDENDEKAILEYTGLTKDEYLAKKSAWLRSNTPVVKNSGTVDVVQSGTGFDSCKSGAIYYDENLGWSYACSYGGVGFGDVKDMHLYLVNEVKLSADDFQVTAGDSIQLGEDGTGEANNTNVHVTCSLPGGQVSNVLTYNFVDRYVDLNDNHATIILNGRYYTVGMNVIPYVVKTTAADPVSVLPASVAPVDVPYFAPVVVEPTASATILPDLCDRINQGEFLNIVKDESLGDMPFTSVARTENNTLKVIADMSNNTSAICNLMVSDELLSAIKTSKVENLMFVVGDYTFSMAADQLNGLSDVVIMVDSSSGKCTITADGVDCTSNLHFTCE